MTQTRPKIIGFDEPPISTADRVSELLHAARAAIIPPSRPATRAADEADGAEHRSAGKTSPEQIIHALDQIAHTLRSDDNHDRIALATALDGVRDALTGLLAGQRVPTSAGNQSAPLVAPTSPRPNGPLEASREILQSEKELPHAVIEEARG
jgi:hypothetical protein